MVCGPEITRCINEFESFLPFNLEETGEITSHHEQTSSKQQRFQKHVHSLVEVFEKYGNPFTEEQRDLIVLDSRIIVGHHLIETISNIERIVKEQFQAFLRNRLILKEGSWYDPIKQYSFSIFSTPKRRKRDSKTNEIKTLKKSCRLFAQLSIFCQARDGNMEEFFSHENNSYPPSLSKNADLRSTKKSHLLTRLEEVIPATCETSTVECVNLDGAAVVNFLKPTGVETFADYANDVFKPCIERQLKDSTRINIVWDSLKSSTRTKRGTGEEEFFQTQKSKEIGSHFYV